MSAYYESDRAVSDYLLFHYGKHDEVLPFAQGPVSGLDYPSRCVTEFADDIGLSSEMRALDLGCAVGRSSFELARWCGEVVGIDYSDRFVQCANRLRDEGWLRYRYLDHGEIMEEGEARIDPAIDRNRIVFEQGDAMFLREGLGTFDVVLLANLIDRLVDPRKCLGALPDLVRPGGFVVLTSPYTWLTEHTPEDLWLGGRVFEDGPYTTSQALDDAMGQAFEKRKRIEMPFLIREHRRKYQWSVAEGTLWQLRRAPEP